MASNTYYELTNPQKRIWLTEAMNNHVDMSNIGYLIEFKDKYNLQKLARAIQYTVKANDSLRLRFTFPEENKGEPVQYLPDYEEINVRILEVQTEHELLEKIEAFHRERFEVNAPNHCAFAVYSIAGERFGFFEKAHHLAADGISAIIVARETISFYHTLDTPDFKELEKPVSYIDFIKDEKEYIESEKYIKDKEYWKETFKDYEARAISFALNPGAPNSLKVNRRSIFIPETLIKKLETFKIENRFTNFGLFMAALATYCHRFQDHSDIVIGMPVHNRSKKQFKEMVGMFVSTIPLRIRFDSDWNFNDLVSYIKKELWEGMKHQGYPYNHLVKDLKEMDVDTSGFLNVQVIELPEANLDYVGKRAFYSTAYNVSQLSIYLNQQTSKDAHSLELAVDYHADIFSEKEIDAFFHRLFIILEQCMDEPVKKISECPFLTPGEIDELITGLNRTEASFPLEKTIPGIFEEQVKKFPGQIALEYENKEITYKEFDVLTDKLAAKLQASGIVPGSIVGILCERSPEAVISIMGILKAGGAYLPIDPQYPLDRKKYIIENSGIRVLLVEKILEEQESELLATNEGVKNIFIDFSELEKEKEAVNFVKPSISPENYAYVIYTSGTTGNPKGTLLRQRNVINYISWGIKVYLQGKPAAFPLYTSLSFDLTVTSIFIPLLTGNRLVIYRGRSGDILIQDVVRENKVDIVKLTPSHLKVVTQLKLENSRIRSFIVGGEEFKTDTARDTYRCFNREVDLFNEYGPTETTVGCMIHRFDKNMDTGYSVPIGKPADNVQIYILDKNKRLLPVGIIGEIYIAGEGVAAGYLKNEKLTDEKFIDNPFTPGKKMYKSGDLGRWNPDRILEYFGRMDEQVKIRGHRIEPGEIEKHLAAVEGVKDAVIAVVRGKETELWAYLVPLENRAPDVTYLRTQLSLELPPYMIPSQFVQVDSIPLTRNGKVDFRKLGEMGKKLDSVHEYIAPRNEMEILLSSVWGSVLSSERIGITDNFFELGGDSIKAVQIAARLNDAGKTVNVKDILTHQTIAALCANVDFESHIRRYEQGTIDGEKGLTPIEKWFFSHPFPVPQHYNQSVLLEFKRDIDVILLEKTFERLIDHHDGLRLNYNPVKNVLFFNNAFLKMHVNIETIDMTGIPSVQAEQFILEKGYEIKGRFDLSKDLLIRAVVFKEAKGLRKVLITVHHLVVDGISWRIILEDLDRVYTSLEKGEPVRMPQKTASLKDWYDALVMYRDSGRLVSEQQYWEKTGREFKLSFDTEPADWNIANRETVKQTLDKQETEFLLTKAHEVYKTDVQILVTSALVRTLRQKTGRQDVEIEMENHGRHIQDIDVNRTVGWFTAIYPLRVDRQDKTIGDEIKTVKESIRKTPSNGIGYGIQTYMGEGEAKTVSRQVPVRFNYLGQFDREVETPLFSYLNIDTGSDISLSNSMTAAIDIDAMIINGVYAIDFHYNSKAFGRQTMESFASNYMRNLKEILDHIRNEDDVHFTPSDFDTVNLGEDDLAALFG